MIVDNIEFVTIIVTLFFLLPILWNIYKFGINNISSFVKVIKILNKSLKIQGIIAIIMLPISWIEELIIGTTFTYFIIAIFYYLPILGLLNGLRLIIELKKESQYTK